MNIVSYNIWNHDWNLSKRIDLLIKTLECEYIDILVLQEVRSESIVKRIKEAIHFPFYLWHKYSDFDEGLAILSKYPITDCWTKLSLLDNHNCGSMNVNIDAGGQVINITNIHLDYEKSLNRELEIVKIIKKIEENNNDNDYNLILGDFNTYPNSILHQFLTGKCSLHEESTHWFDLAEVYAIKNQTNTECTLDFDNNPRWDNQQVLDIPGRFDWILLKNQYSKKHPVLNQYKRIGVKRVEGMVPSDHYGIFCEIDF